MRQILKDKSVLIVEDNLADAFLCEEILLECGFLSVNIRSVSKIAELDEIWGERQFDVVLLDLFLPDSKGFDTFDKVKHLLEEAVIIVMSGLRDQETALNAVYKGAQDFILKDELDAKLLKKTIIYGFERKRNLQLLKESEVKYKSLFDLSPLPLILFDTLSLEIIEVNQAALELYKYSKEQFSELKLVDIFHTITENELKACISSQSGISCKHSNKEGGLIDTDSYVSIANANQSILLVKDMTEHVMFEKKKMLLVNQIQDKERKHFAMELHDGLAQQLVLLNMYLSQISKNNDSFELVSKCKEISNNAIAQTRVLTYNLKPPFLDEGLMNGITALFNRLSLLDGTSIELTILDDQIKAKTFDYEVSYNVFRIIQEFINNSLKHAQSSTVNCTINTIDDRVYFELSDNGIGFDERTVKKNMGLVNIEERSKLYTTDYKFNSAPGRGTRLYFVIDA